MAPVNRGSTGETAAELIRIAPGAESGERVQQIGSIASTAGSYSAVFQFTIFNLAAFALLGAAYMQGWIGTILEADSSHLTIGIFGVFVFGLALCAHKIWRYSRELESVHHYDPSRRSAAALYLSEVTGRGSGSRRNTASAMFAKYSSGVAIVRHIANTLVLLGLIGTVIGFVIALSGVDPEQAGEVSAIAPMVADLIAGMSVALYTTLVGAVLNLWLMVNYHILSSVATKLTTGLIALGEANARA